MNENNGSSTMSFDRMRNMLVRAAEIRESEQQQIFDALDEIHARMAPLDSVGAMRKRLSEMPDRTEVGVLAERLDEAMSKLEAQDTALAELSRAVESIVDKLAKPFAQLDGRLDGMAGRFEGVAGRMDGLEDKLEHIHKRLDELDQHLGKQDGRLEELPRTVRADFGERADVVETTVRARVDELDASVRHQLETAQQELVHQVTTTSEQTAAKVDKSHLLLHGKLDEAAQKLDSSDRLDAQGARLDTVDDRLQSLTARVEEVVSRLETTENTLAGRLGELSGSLAQRPTEDMVRDVVHRAHEMSERQHAGHLDEAMATFAELIMGGSPVPSPPQIAMPRQPPRRNNRKATSKAKTGGHAGDDGDPDTDR